MKFKKYLCSLRGHKLDGPNYISRGVVGPVYCERCDVYIFPSDYEYPSITIHNPPESLGYIIINNSEFGKYFKDIDS